MDGHDRLTDDRPAVEFRADEMNRAAGKAHAGGERLPLRMQTAKGGEQRGMNIDHPVAPRLHEIRIQYSHESGKADEPDPVLAKPQLRLRSEGAPVARRDDHEGHAGRGREPEARRFSPAADDEDDLGWVG